MYRRKSHGCRIRQSKVRSSTKSHIVLQYVQHLGVCPSELDAETMATCEELLEVRYTFPDRAERSYITFCGQSLSPSVE